MNRKAFIFSIEAILALAAALTLASYPLAGASPLYGDVRLFQLGQDLAEITVKSPENLDALRQFAATGESILLEERYSALLEELGGYCARLEANGKTMRVNCGDGIGNESGTATGFTAERIFWDGAAFETARLSVSLSRGD